MLQITQKYFQLGLLFLILLIGPVQSTTCNSFPKIFGGSSTGSYLGQIDVYNDYLALAGSINDNSLTGISSTIPYLALTSIQVGGYYWVKALSLKANTKFDAVQFSTDGALLIAYGYSSSSYIVVFNVNSGNILSARSYFDGGQNNYNYLIRSIKISSGSSPYAYVLSNYQTSSSCSGQHLLKFDPLVFSSTPVWRQKTLGTTNCGHLGLTFGRTESLLYAFSWYNGFSTISLLDSDGNSKWQYSTPDGDPNYSNTINYKEIDAATDMVILTSGLNNINYSQIFHSSSASITPSYQVNNISNKTLRDSTRSSSDHLYALYIIDKDQSVCLLWGPSLNTYLATLNFLTQKISYQRAFPSNYSLKSVIFTSATIYYAGYRDNYFYSDETSSHLTFSAFHSQVFSSDMTKTSCYSMVPIVSSTANMVIPISTITQISSPIYQSSSLTFANDAQSYTTVDIAQSQIFKITTCIQNPFTVNTVTQSQSIFSVEQGGSDSNFPITPFSAYCGTQALTWSYSGHDNYDGHSLVETIDLMSVNSATGAIFVSSSKPVGTYTIKLIGTLSYLVTSTSAIFTINVKANSVPVFSSPLTDMTAPLMSSTNYQFPSIIDPDNGAKTSVSVVKDSATGFLPSFITVASTSLAVYPKLMAHVKAFTMIVIITDTKDTKQYQFIINVTNQPPITTSSLITPFNIDFGKTNTYNLPSSKDPEGLPYTTSLNSGPSYVTFDSINNKLTLTPTNCATDFSKSTVKIDLTDEQPLTTSYSIDFQVNNQPPIFSASTPLPNQAVMTNTNAYYTIPCSDPEGCPLLFQTTPLLPFVSINGNQIKFNPYHTQNGTYIITISCTDNQKISVNAAFNLIVYQPPKFNGPVIQQIDLFASNPANYSLPIIKGISDEHVNHSSTLPRYVTFVSPLYQFLPDRVSDLGIQTIQGSLCNTYTCINFEFNLNVTNYPPYINGTISDFIISRDTAISYFIPQTIDRERQSINLLAQEVNEKFLPGFIKFNNITQEFLFEPTQLDIASNYQIQLILNDTFGASSSYQFRITLFNPPSLKKPSSKINKKNPSSSQNNATLAVYLNLLKNQSEIKTQMLTMEIVKVTRDQKASIKIKDINNQKAAVQDIIVLITNKSFQLVVEQESISYRIDFFINEKDLANSLLNLNLKYPKPLNLSLNSTDKLKLKTVQKFQKTKKQIQTILPENIESEANIPQQILTEIDLKALLGQTIQGGRIAFTENTPQNMAIGFLIQIIWIQLLDISFLATNSMLAITIPGIPSIIQSVMIKYIYFDILYTEFWFSQFMSKIGIDIDEIQNDDALNQQFSENGFNSKYFLKNSGSSIIFLVLYIISWFIFSIVAILSLFSTRMYSLKEYIKSQLVWKQSINLLMSQFPPLFLCCILNFHDMRFKGDETAAEISTYLSLIVMVIVLTALILLFLKVWGLTRKLDQASVKEFKNSYQPLYDSFKETLSQKLIYFWKPLNMLRWAITLIILTELKDKPSFQILSLLILSVVQQCLLLTSQPFNSKALNIISIYNEVAVSLYLYVSILVSDYLETQINDNQEKTDSLRLFFAWILTSLLIFTIFVNFLQVLAQIVASMLRYLKNKIKCCKRSVAKYEQNIDKIENEYQIQKNSNQNSISVPTSSDITQFENEYFDNIPKSFIQSKPKKQANKNLFPIMNGQQEFYDMFEMKQ